MDAIARRPETRAQLPTGLRFAVPIEWLIPRVVAENDDESESQEAYDALLAFVKTGRIQSENDHEYAHANDWVPRLKEFAELAFFFEAAASSYEMLTTAVDNGKGIDAKRAIDGMKRLTSYGKFVEETEE